MMLAALGRFFRRCMDAAIQQEAERCIERGYSDFMTDAEIIDRMNGRGHLINWNEVRRRQEAGENQSPWAKKGEEQVVV